ncbi:MAG: NapC/NirT family cytochrome c, partial [Candidatus Cloacimonetes bacterium]|nr:NapC/NirT family cytochrome c [Candidatus Cloacimonadota bacterium]
MSRKSKRNFKPKKKYYRRKGFFLSLGIIIGVIMIAALYQTSVYFSTNESCMMCHVHPHAEESWRLSTHVNNGSGVMVNCVDCHLPPKDNTWEHYSAKVALG